MAYVLNHSLTSLGDVTPFEARILRTLRGGETSPLFGLSFITSSLRSWFGTVKELASVAFPRPVLVGSIAIRIDFVRTYSSDTSPIGRKIFNSYTAERFASHHQPHPLWTPIAITLHRFLLNIKLKKSFALFLLHAKVKDFEKVVNSAYYYLYLLFYLNSTPPLSAERFGAGGSGRVQWQKSSATSRAGCRRPRY